MKKKILLLITTILTLILEALPYGAVLNFANPEGESWRRTYSYFNPTPFGYANFAPFIVAILSCVLLILIIVSILAKKPLKSAIIILSSVTAILSLCPLLYGIRYMSLVGALISVVLFITAAIAVFLKD